MIAPCSKMHYFASLIFDTLILPNRKSATNHRPDFRLVVFLYPFYRKEVCTMEKTTMSVQELSAQMGISLAKAYELAKTPGFPTLRIGTRILIPVDAYKNWLLHSAANK
jgi:excisionase family DNA binding protein